MKDTDFLFQTSALCVREADMREKMAHVIAAPSFAKAAKILADCGYPDMSGMDSVEIEDALADRREDIFAEFAGDNAALKIVNLFRVKYDYHNAKALIKSAGTGLNALQMLSASGRVECEALADAFENAQFLNLPPILAGAIDNAREIFARTGNPQLADSVLDKAYFAELSALSGELGDPFIDGYIRLLIDSANLRITIRVGNAGLGADFLDTALIPGGGTDLLPETSHNASLSQVEQTIDNAVMRYISEADYISFGAGSVLAYLAKLEREIIAVRMIFLGIPADVIMERIY
ncbi:MAG: V-type ATPase subunit [Oscillospiraceae bacterium]|nr:V-type ATPase subunit [Oscillospiraceae bacterium]